MKKGDKVRTIENFPYMGVSRRNVGVVVSQSKYKIPDGKGSINPNRGWDVEVKFRHKYGTCIFQGEELKIVSQRKSK